MARNLTIELRLQPPAGAEPPVGLEPKKTSSFALPTTESGDAKAFYAALSSAINNAKEATGAELTQWRDAVAVIESGKESKKPKDDEDEDEDEEVDGSDE